MSKIQIFSSLRRAIARSCCGKPKKDRKTNKKYEKSSETTSAKVQMTVHDVVKKERERFAMESKQRE